MGGNAEVNPFRIGHRRICAIVFFTFLVAGWLQTEPAWASGDFGCSISWTLKRTRLDCDNLAFLSPGNDSRVNLQLLLLDAGQSKIQ
ncbi:MAG: hypothetical protein ACREDV_00060, partial [Methylocella sp.]